MRRMRPLLLACGLLLATSAVACSPPSSTSAAPDAAAPRASAASSPVSSASSATPAPSATATARADRKSKARLSSADRAAVLRDLEAGRKLARAKDWNGALAVFDKALARSPDDARLLAEVGWAAFQTKDFARAETANQRALAGTKDPTRRAQILYNMGRVAEARGDKSAAKSAYGDSLALRDNAEVKSRFTSVGGVVDDTASSLPCNIGHANPAAMCACLVAHKGGVFVLGDEPAKCTGAKGAPRLGDARLGIFLWGTDGLGENAYVLAVREGATTRPLVELGRDYEPGAFGVHNEASVKGGEARTVGGHTVVVLRSEQDDSDSNMAGLELCTNQVKRETVCALGDAPGSSRCTPPIPVDTQAGCGPGVEPDPGELDAETRAAQEEIKKHATSSHAVTAWSIADDGKVTVRFVSGAKDLVPSEVLRVHPLW